jgi:hypothetical protein
MYRFTNVLEVFAASIIRAMIALMMEAASTSEMSVNFYQTSRQQPRRQPSSVTNIFEIK